MEISKMVARINPRVDVAFKKIFGVEENKDLLISLINSIVGEADQVADVTLLNPYNPKNFANDKLSILDIKAKGLDGRLFNIEMQITDEADYDKRALYYWGKLYTEQLKQGDDYGTLSKAIGIHILNFFSIPESKDYHNIFHITEKKTGFKYFDDLELHTIELKKFTDSLTVGGDELGNLLSKVKTSLDTWVAFLTKYDLLNKDNLPREFTDNKVDKALNILEIVNLDDNERMEYEDHLKWIRAQTSALKKKEREAKAEGLAEGMKKGIEKEKNETIIKMIQQGFDDDITARVTGASIDKITQIKSKL